MEVCQGLQERKKAQARGAKPKPKWGGKKSGGKWPETDRTSPPGVISVTRKMGFKKREP